ncbi:hypothetical protein H072_6333 [Dactylellina haptotyla CBS 200.50]|uniref:Uncharacterized protein n=1 Tax=Dactylellina haptotyla (strain CBS 200.50) TaxID=1284197 RepID=S8AA49_DACHA|nr:hypothetical protein H072_6333 [Dactylellina haptotyla CBS 200.50]
MKISQALYSAIFLITTSAAASHAPISFGRIERRDNGTTPASNSSIPALTTLAVVPTPTGKGPWARPSDAPRANLFGAAETGEDFKKNFIARAEKRGGNPLKLKFYKEAPQTVWDQLADLNNKKAAAARSKSSDMEARVAQYNSAMKSFLAGKIPDFANLPTPLPGNSRGV